MCSGDPTAHKKKRSPNLHVMSTEQELAIQVGELDVVHIRHRDVSTVTQQVQHVTREVPAVDTAHRDRQPQQKQNLPHPTPIMAKFFKYSQPRAPHPTINKCRSMIFFCSC